MSLTFLSIGIILLATAAVVGGLPVIQKGDEEREEKAKTDDKPQVSFDSQQGDGEEDLGGKKKRKQKTVKLLITGFGQFPGYPGTNPSSETASKLNETVLLSSPPPLNSPSSDSSTVPTPSSTRIEITFMGPLPVSYTQIAALVPPLHESGEYDAMIHVGVASRFKGGLMIEQRGRRTGYISVGSDGLPAPKEGVENWVGGKGEEEELWTRVDAKGCRDWLEKEMGVEHITTSEDAGRYLCEFIYGTSLNASRRTTTTPIPILFAHVPDLRPSDKPYEKGDPVYTQEDVTEVLRRICWWVGNGGWE